MKLQNGDYLQVSEIKTEQDFNDVVKAAENCGVDYMTPVFTSGDFLRFNFIGVEPSILFGRGSLKVAVEPAEKKNQLTLSEWLERGGVEREDDGNTIKPLPELKGCDDEGRRALPNDFSFTSSIDKVIESELKPFNENQAGEETKGWMPEVGQECLFSCGSEKDEDFNKCLIAGFHVKTGRPIIDHLKINKSLSHASECWKFKPLPATEEVEREEFVKGFWEDLGNFENPDKDGVTSRNSGIMRAKYMYNLGYRKTK